MKKHLIITIKTLTVLLFIFYAFSRFSPAPPSPQPQYLIDDLNNIVGTFVNNKDPDWMLIFDANGKCYKYEAGVPTTTYTYTITKSTPQCGVEVDVNESQETDYLQLTDDSTNSTDCYVINGISSILSIRPVGAGGLLIFNKQ